MSNDEDVENTLLGGFHKGHYFQDIHNPDKLASTGRLISVCIKCGTLEASLEDDYLLKKWPFVGKCPGVYPVIDDVGWLYDEEKIVLDNYRASQKLPRLKAVTYNSKDYP